MSKNQKTRPLLAAIFLAVVVALLLYGVQGGGFLTAQIFDGDGLVDGLDKAKTELGTKSGIRDDTDLVDAIVAVINFILLFAGIFAFVAFVVAGFMFILGFGSDQANQRARKIMIWAAVGLLVIIFAYVIVDFIVDFATAT